jgi:hypothetical protein
MMKKSTIQSVNFVVIQRPKKEVVRRARSATFAGHVTGHFQWIIEKNQYFGHPIWMVFLSGN